MALPEGFLEFYPPKGKEKTMSRSLCGPLVLHELVAAPRQYGRQFLVRKAGRGRSLRGEDPLAPVSRACSLRPAPGRSCPSPRFTGRWVRPPTILTGRESPVNSSASNGVPTAGEVAPDPAWPRPPFRYLALTLLLVHALWAAAALPIGNGNLLFLLSFLIAWPLIALFWIARVGVATSVRLGISILTIFFTPVVLALLFCLEVVALIQVMNLFPCP